ncbi:MAG: 1,2-phenylacetyl-CoA epoxidase subunit PaaD [bacterium]|nr:1,2-phenylacetyl-CoA epoxidase subunit PaaD [bacterium]
MTVDDILLALQDVKDPEIPTISVVDLGIVTKIEIINNVINVVITPTFVGCPAIDIMKRDVETALRTLGADDVHVEVNYDIPWSTNRVSERGRAALLKHGLAPPQPYTVEFELDVLNDTACPFCGSRNTTMKSPFGPTLCRSLHYCNNCLQAFEGFKPL